MHDLPVILVADDERPNRALVHAYLSPQYRVIEVEDGSRALSALEHEGAVDLVLLDVRMPGKSGVEVCREIKAMARPGFLPVVLLTALTAQEDRRAGLQAGADDFLTKPVDPVELKLRCAALIERRRQEATIRKQVEELRSLQRLKDELFLLIVHDVRNPLQGVEGHLQMVRPALDGLPEIRADIDAAYRSARRIRELVDSVLEVRLLEHGKLPLQRASFLVAEVISEALTTLEARRRRAASPSAPRSAAPSRSSATGASSAARSRI
jgi:two-component system sensor histidine kinase/response regulator